MIVCLNCNHHNPEEAQTCEECGASLEHFAYRVCPACGALSPAQNTYCHRCLTELVSRQDEEAESLKVSVKPFEPTEPLPPELARPPRDSGRPRSEPMDPTPDDVAPTAHEDVSQKTLRSEEAAPASSLTEQSRQEIAEAQETPPEESFLFIAPERVSPEKVEEERAAEDAESLLAVTLPDALSSELADLNDLLPIETAIASPHRAKSPPHPIPSETEQYDAELFHKVATEPAPLGQAAHIILPRQTKVMPGVGRALLYLLVLLAALVPVVTGGQAIGASIDLQPRDTVLALLQTIDALPADAKVLISFDYDPAYAGELDELALAPIRHLADRSVNMIVMSTKPGGVGVADRIYRTISSEWPAYQDYGERYALLGYLPGQAAGLRNLCSTLGNAFKTDYLKQCPLSELPVTQGIATLAEFDHILVLSDDSQSVRRWIEQVHSRTNIPLGALVAARIKPMLIPYKQSGQLDALLGGTMEAAEYRVARQGETSVLGSSDAYAALFGVLVLVAVITNVTYFAHRKQNQ